MSTDCLLFDPPLILNNFLIRSGNMKIDKSSSERLDIIKFPLIVGVVFIHAYDTQVVMAGQAVGVASSSELSDFIRNLISQGFARTAVPLFFLISGFLFFQNFSYCVSGYKKKLKSRVNTLLIPYLFWNIATLFLVALVQSVPVAQSLISGMHAPVSTYGAYDYLNAIFGIDRFPISYQFWFIRDLIILILLVPLIHLILKFVPHAMFATLFALWFLDIWFVYSPSVLAVTFFYIGTYLANQNKSLFALDKFGSEVTFAYLIVLGADMMTGDNLYHLYIHNTGIVLGCISALFLTNSIVKSSLAKRFFLWCSSFSFFVFATHEPLLNLLRKLAYKTVMPHSDLAVLSLYFLIPILTVMLCTLLYLGMKKFTPRFLNIIAGGR